MLTENNTRKGFLELDQFELLLKYLPEEYHALYEVAYITGWRRYHIALFRSININIIDNSPIEGY
jgi:hypothetical protein